MKLVLSGNLETALIHFALIGLASILQDQGAQHVRIGWQDGAMAQPIVTWQGPEAGQAVLAHALQHANPESWVQAMLPPPEDAHGLFSPRIKAPASTQGWQAVEDARESYLAGDLSALDHRMIVNLGEPGYWVEDKGQPRPDSSASRWEMKTRNRGEEFIGQRLAPLATEVATWSPDSIANGLTGTTVRDAVGSNAVDSRTPTGLSSPGPTDNALAWCALWGISAFTLVPQVSGMSATAGAVPPGRNYPDFLAVPVTDIPCSLAMWRGLARSHELLNSFSKDPLVTAQARQSLGQRGVIGACTFPMHASDNKSAPERSLLSGTFHWFGEAGND